MGMPMYIIINPKGIPEAKAIMAPNSSKAKNGVATAAIIPTRLLWKRLISEPGYFQIINVIAIALGSILLHIATGESEEDELGIMYGNKKIVIALPSVPATAATIIA